ncbi:putative acetyltransferase [Streptomyces himastatinicus ATCC 53653]|uniref:Putative acetyltransferase n=1 Tax=Streptomyces himastatinicus ATCC 53653 TaxID=457427 RepID=D9WLF3_9ACTN|nr:putative acetyltransferase [Streptomyces himastatinicus ATCC 53653]
MTDLGPVAWPPAPIRTERLVLREPEARDRAAVIELLASPEVGTYLGGPRPRDELERAMPGAPPSAGCREGRTRLPVPAGGMAIRIRRRGVPCASRPSWGSPR